MARWEYVRDLAEDLRTFGGFPGPRNVARLLTARARRRALARAFRDARGGAEPGVGDLPPQFLRPWIPTGSDAGPPDLPEGFALRSGGLLSQTAACELIDRMERLSTALTRTAEHLSAAVQSSTYVQPEPDPRPSWHHPAALAAAFAVGLALGGWLW